jgi:hypothetical protein
MLFPKDYSNSWMDIYALKFKFVEEEIEIRIESLKNELDEIHENFKSKLAEIKKNFFRFLKTNLNFNF